MEVGYQEGGETDGLEIASPKSHLRLLLEAIARLTYDSTSYFGMHCQLIIPVHQVLLSITIQHHELLPFILYTLIRTSGSLLSHLPPVPTHRIHGHARLQRPARTWVPHNRGLEERGL